jgi:hypothetical protein
VAELTQPYVDPFETAAAEAAAARQSSLSRGVPPFRATRAPTGAVFGYVDADLQPVPATEFYKSVHLAGLSKAEATAAAEAKAVAKAAEEAKRVVATTSFLPYHSPDASRSDRYHSLLRQPPQKLGLKLGVSAPSPVSTKKWIGIATGDAASSSNKQ